MIFELFTLTLALVGIALTIQFYYANDTKTMQYFGILAIFNLLVCVAAKLDRVINLLNASLT